MRQKPFDFGALPLWNKILVVAGVVVLAVYVAVMMAFGPELDDPPPPKPIGCSEPADCAELPEFPVP